MNICVPPDHFQVVPFVEVEDVFVSKALHAGAYYEIRIWCCSMQLKLREWSLRYVSRVYLSVCRGIVFPPAERLMVRSSVCFPDRVCSTKNPQEDEETTTTGGEIKRSLEVDEVTTAKRCKVSDEEEEEEEEEENEPRSVNEPV